MGAAACLIKYLDLLADENLFGKFKLRELALDGHMKLDRAATKALNLFPQVHARTHARTSARARTHTHAKALNICPQAQDGNRNVSLYSLLNKCKTAIGSRLLMRWLKQPLVDKAEIEGRHDLVGLLIDQVQVRQSLQETYLRHVPDLARLTRKLQKSGKSSLVDAWRLYQFVQQLPALRHALEEAEEASSTTLLKERLIEPLGVLEESFKKYQQLVEQSLDLDGIDHHEYRINPRYNQDLLALAEQKADILSDIQEERRRAASKLGLQDGVVKLERNKDKLYTLRITRKDEKVLRTKAATFPVLETRKDGVKFTSDKLRPLADAYKQHDEEYERIQSELVEQVMGIIATYAPAVEQLCDVVAEVDVLVALAHVASNAPEQYVRPSLAEAGTGDLVLMQARHPCVEAMDDVSFIPNDVVLRRGDSNLQIITGPNMGGKSTYIRQAGVIVLMAQVGSFVPCASADISICTAIHARIGAGDNQVKGVSTFMQEMLDTASILNAATDKSLIIIDELGRGTSTYDGFGLAWSISEHIATHLKAPCLFATHFHELTDLAKTVPHVSNRHVKAQVEEGKLTMLYQVRDGPSDQSFGIHVAEIARFPEHVVSMARRKADELEMLGNTGMYTYRHRHMPCACVMSCAPHMRCASISSACSHAQDITGAVQNMTWTSSAASERRLCSEYACRHARTHARAHTHARAPTTQRATGDDASEKLTGKKRKLDDASMDSDVEGRNLMGVSVCVCLSIRRCVCVCVCVFV